MPVTGLSELLRNYARAEIAASRPPGCVGMNDPLPKDHLSWAAADALDAAEIALADARNALDRALDKLRSGKP